MSKNKKIYWDDSNIAPYPSFNKLADILECLNNKNDKAIASKYFNQSSDEISDCYNKLANEFSNFKKQFNEENKEIKKQAKKEFEPIAGGGRKKIFNSSDIKKMTFMKKSGFNWEAIAREMNSSPRTIKRYLKEYNNSV